MRPRVILRDATTRDWLSFTEPVEVVVATRVPDVMPALRQVEALVADRGLHAAGFLAYEAAPAFDAALAVRTSDDFPLLWFGLYGAPAPVAPPERGTGGPSRRDAALWTPDVSRKDYDAALDRIKAHLAEGESYQVNYTFRLRSPWHEDPWTLFLDLAPAEDATYGAYADIGRFAICSVSPELFFERDGRRLTCRPMKGTLRRGRFTVEDLAQAETLRSSAKNRAENVMIVDMVRNDLGRVADVGSVAVPSLFDVARFRTLWQMTSTVTALTDAGTADVIAALFPCASITGAPKVRTTEIIARLETTPRRIYTGCIGMMTPGGRAQFSVAIRTALVDREQATAEYGVGGGIVWDSRAADEYEESLLKARVLTSRAPEMSLLETLLWRPRAGYALLDRHLTRLGDSAEYFGVPLDQGRVRADLLSFAAALGSVPQVVRLLVARDGTPSLEARPFVDTPSPVRLQLAPKPVDSTDVFLFHKTTRRSVYDEARAACPDADDVLLWNERREITETTIANVVIDVDGAMWTPPVSSGLLAGTFRAALIAAGTVQERVVTVDMIETSRRIQVVNSVRGVRDAVIEPVGHTRS